MKIIYIANARIPTEKAHGIQIMQMCRAFANAGVTVELLIPRRINWIKEDPFKYYGIERNFKIKKMPCLDLIPFSRYIGHFGLWVESLTFFVSVFFYAFFKKTDIFYTREKLILPLALMKKNFIFEAHTFPRNYFLYSSFTKRLKGIVVITQKLKELFAERGADPEKILVAPDGVDIEKFDIRCSMFEAREKLGLPQNKKIVLYAGHLYEWKGAQVLAEASQYFLPEIEVYFVGGTAEDKKKFEIRNLKLEINAVGHRPHSEIPLWLKAADVLVLPNSGREDISKYWTSPLKLFEYMASKRPIVASNLPSIREILNKENAILVESDNPEALARGIQDALRDLKLSDRISTRALQDVQGFSWEKRAQKLCQIF